MSLVAYAYREELKALYYGRLKLKDPLTNAHSNSGPNNPNPQAQPGGAYSGPAEVGAENSALMAPPAPPQAAQANQAATSPFNTVITTPNDYERPRARVLAPSMAPPKAPQYKNPASKRLEGALLPTAYVPIKAMITGYGERMPPSPPPQYKNSAKDQVDHFKLPTAKKAVIKSTGSGYFQQMMQGKKPVSSISQYQLIKDELNKNKNKNKKQDKEKRKHKKHQKT